ncbi:MAG: hypothetical protein WCX20_02390 [Candidatus Shapirobacteria bacterium]|jgi:hypothetical protein
MECYKLNRTRVFEIYNINPANPLYNCHHIVTREDRKLGLVPPDFDLNVKSNLFPSLVNDHKSLHKTLNLLEPRISNKEQDPIFAGFKRVNLNSSTSFFIDPNIIKKIDSPVVREKSCKLRFLLWHRQGVL